MKSLTNSLRSKAHFPAIKVKLILIYAMACAISGCSNMNKQAWLSAIEAQDLISLYLGCRWFGY
jgi:hypothetical protein